MKKYYALAVTLLITGTGAFAAAPEGMAKVAKAIAVGCGLPCC